MQICKSHKLVDYLIGLLIALTDESDERSVYHSGLEPRFPLGQL